MIASRGLQNLLSAETQENNKVTFLALKEKRKKSRRLHWKVWKGISWGCESDSKVGLPNFVTFKFIFAHRLTRVHVTIKSFSLWSRFYASQISCWHANPVYNCLQIAWLLSWRSLVKSQSSYPSNKHWKYYLTIGRAWYEQRRFNYLSSSWTTSPCSRATD